MEIYVLESWSDASPVQLAAGLQENRRRSVDVRFFPTPARLTEQNLQGFRSMLWPVYADHAQPASAAETRRGILREGDDQVNDEEPPRSAAARRATSGFLI